MKRFLKGGLLLYVLKLSFIAVILLIHACQDSVAPDEPLERFNSFLKSERHVIVEALNGGKKGQAAMVIDQSITEDDAQILMIPTLNASQALLDYYGFQDSEFIEELGVIDETVKIHTALAILEAERLFNSSNTYTASALMFNQALADDSIGTCLLEAVGVGALYDWAVGKAVISRKLLIRAVGKALSRTIGWVGTALAVADFVWCMNRE